MSEELMQEAVAFARANPVCLLATVEGDQARVRPFGTIHLFDGKLYIQTGKVKAVSKQIAANPKIEICAFDGKEWLRLKATAVDDDRLEAKQSMLDAYPSLQARYAADDGNCQVLYLKDAVATFSSFAAPPRAVEF